MTNLWMLIIFIIGYSNIKSNQEEDKTNATSSKLYKLTHPLPRPTIITTDLKYFSSKNRCDKLAKIWIENSFINVTHEMDISYLLSSKLEIQFQQKKTTKIGLQLFFNTCNENFVLALQVQSNHLQIRDNYHQFPQTKSGYFTFGQLVNDSSSTVFGSIQKNYFNFVIQTNRLRIYIEPLKEKIGSSKNAVILLYQDADILNSRTNTLFPIRNKLNVRVERVVSSTDGQDIAERRSCGLLLVLDHTFIGNGSKDMTVDSIEEVLFYVNGATEIFAKTDFNGDGNPDNIGFHVESIKIYNKSSTEYNLQKDDLTSDEVLLKFSEYDYSSYCLAILFTKRDFSDGVLGLAWVAESSLYGAPGGICQEPVLMGEKYGNKPYSLNTLLVTAVNYGSTAPRRLTVLTLAHELGHSFGSSHDKETDQRCAPNGLVGHHLMFPYSTDGLKPNQRKFSPCSKDLINPVLQKKGTCLKMKQYTTCGNLMVDPGEECDCGTKDICELVDPCCVPVGGIGTDKECHIRVSHGYYCSPKQSLCCNSSCQMVPYQERKVCLEATECRLASFCTGERLVCPEQELKMDGTPCEITRNISSVCVKGECVTDICKIHNLSTCQCVLPESSMCIICCLSAEICLPAHKIGIILSPIYLLPGSACNNYTGYCSEKNECLAVKDDLNEKLKTFFGLGTPIIIKGRFFNYFGLIVLSFAPLAFVLSVYFARRKKASLSSDEKASIKAKMQILWNRAQREFAKLEKKTDFVNNVFNRKVFKLFNTNKSMDFAVALSRLHTFFPVAPDDMIRNVIRTSQTEEEAVAKLLMKGCAMRRLA